MTARYVLAISAVTLFTISAAQAQNMSTGESATMQQGAQGAQSAPGDTAYGGTRPASMAGSSSQDAWSTGAERLCTVGLSCNIYRGQ